jgi:colanic acid/amylovoran biosynthesis protein
VQLKIGIVNTVLLNGGDAAICAALMAILRRTFGDETSFDIFDGQAADAARYYGDWSIHEQLYKAVSHQRLRLSSKETRLSRAVDAARHLAAGDVRKAKRLVSKPAFDSLSALAGVELVVSTGGTYLVEHYSLRPRIFCFDIIRALRKPFVLFTQSMGPFRQKDNRLALGRLLPRAELILLRDEISKRHAVDVGCSAERCTVVADGVFASADAAVLKAAQTRDLGEPLKIAVSVRNWAHFEGGDTDGGMRRYSQAVASLVTHLVRSKNAQVTFLSTCQGIEEYWTDDSRLARTIVDGLAQDVQEHCTVDNAFHSPPELGGRLASFDAVVATRMHMAIQSLINGTPVFPISYEFKTSELFGALGRADWVQDINSLDAQTIVPAFDAFLSAIPGARAELFEAVEGMVESAGQAGPAIKHAVLPLTV